MVTFKFSLADLIPAVGQTGSLRLSFWFSPSSLTVTAQTPAVSLLLFIHPLLPPTPPIPSLSSRTRGPCSLRTSGIWCGPSFSSCSDRRPSPSNSGSTCSRKRCSLLCPSAFSVYFQEVVQRRLPQLLQHWNIEQLLYSEGRMAQQGARRLF